MVAATGDTRRMPPPLPAPPLPTFWPLSTDGDPPPSALRMAVLVPVPMVMVPDALISNAPPPAPPAPAPLPPVPPAQPPRSGWRFVPLLTAPPAAVLPPAFPPEPPAVPNPPPPPPDWE